MEVEFGTVLKKLDVEGKWQPCSADDVLKNSFSVSELMRIAKREIYGELPWQNDDHGNRIYFDIGSHFEIGVAEASSIKEATVAYHVGMLLAQQLSGTERVLDEGQFRLDLNSTVVDSIGNSWGTHMNCLYKDGGVLADNKYYRTLGTAQTVNMLIQSGGLRSVDGELNLVRSQKLSREDGIACLYSESTTLNRPLVNTRNEPLVSPTEKADGYRRRHAILQDTLWLPFGTGARFAVQQIIEDAIYGRLDLSGVRLVDPVRDALVVAHSSPLDDPKVEVELGGEKTETILVSELLRRVVSLDTDSGDEVDIWRGRLQEVADAIKEDPQSLNDRLDNVRKQAILDEIRQARPDANLVAIHRLFHTIGDGEAALNLFDRLDEHPIYDPDDVLGLARDNYKEAEPLSLRAKSRVNFLREKGSAAGWTNWSQSVVNHPGEDLSTTVYFNLDGSLSESKPDQSTEEGEVSSM